MRDQLNTSITRLCGETRRGASQVTRVNEIPWLGAWLLLFTLGSKADYVGIAFMLMVLLKYSAPFIIHQYPYFIILTTELA